MAGNYEWDIFISFAREDALEQVRELSQKMTDCGLRVFYDKKIRGATAPFLPQIEHALEKSQHLLLYWSENAENSQWVRSECEAFFNSYHIKDREQRQIHVMIDPTGRPDKLPLLIRTYNYSISDDELIARIVKTALDDSKECFSQLEKQLENQLGEARKLYRHSRFWGAIAQRGDVHIFTCGRDIPAASTGTRGQGGRTNIDMWDYRAVLDITHFFASSYPNAKVTIEDPVSKLHEDDLSNSTRLNRHIRNIERKLQNKDCIIVGSPDVSDFAEIILAELHDMEPYALTRVKRSGFVIIKKEKITRSSCYWEKEPHDQEGVAQIIGQGHYDYFPHRSATEDGNPGQMYGIIVAANNPFCVGGHRRRIIILSGFSGVATDAMAKILTEDNYLNEFFKFDQAYVNMDQSIEALIRVKYVLCRNSGERDTRRIENEETSITFERLVEIPST
jgi:hypothetical protein